MFVATNDHFPQYATTPIGLLYTVAMIIAFPYMAICTAVWSHDCFVCVVMQAHIRTMV